MTKPKPIDPVEAGRWHAIDSDGPNFIVRHFGMPMVLVSWNADRLCWGCSEDGLFNSWTMSTCVHIQAACRRMPLAVALRVCADIAAKRIARAPITTERTGPDERTIAEARAAIARAEARARDERNRDRDAEHRERTGEVITRRATDEDRERLRMARERKAKAYETPVTGAR